MSHLSLVTLGVRDLARARAFYEALGYVASSASTGDVVFFDAGGVALALYPWHLLAEDAAVPPDGAGFRGVSLAHNVASESAADEVIARAVAAGATLVKPPQRVFWGGYSGYFADPDGHLWEVAHNPLWPLDARGRIELPA